MGTQDNWSIRPYREGDEGKIFELQKAVHPERQNESERWFKWWHWKYKEVPCGIRTWLAEDNGKILAQLSAIIMNLKVGNDIIKAAQFMDSVTHPDYRRQGIITTLTRNLQYELKQNGVHILYGFPNALSYQINKKLGAFDIAAMHKMIKVFKWESALRKRISNQFLLKLCAMVGNLLNNTFLRVSRAPAVSGLSISKVSCFDERINEFWDRVSKQFKIIFERRKDYLNWRFSAVPDVNYSMYVAKKAGMILGYLVMRCRQDGCPKTAAIYDLLAESEEVAQCLLHTVVEYCRRDGMDYVYWVGIANKTYLGAFRKRGFISIPFRKKGEFYIYSSSPNISGDFLRNPQNWLVQTGDSDHL